jgi:hypothetical protein
VSVEIRAAISSSVTPAAHRALHLGQDRKRIPVSAKQANYHVRILRIHISSTQMSVTHSEATRMKWFRSPFPAES